MAIYKGNESGVAVGGNIVNAFIGSSKGKAIKAVRIFMGDETGIARLVYQKKHGYTEDDPYLIRTAEDFQRIRFEPSACYRLEDDITLKSKVFDERIEKFYGVFDGNGHKIIILDNGLQLGYGFYVNYGTVKNVTRWNQNYNSGDGPFISINRGIVENCYCRAKTFNGGALVLKNDVGGVMRNILCYLFTPSTRRFLSGDYVWRDKLKTDNVYCGIAEGNLGSISDCVIYGNKFDLIEKKTEPPYERTYIYGKMRAIGSVNPEKVKNVWYTKMPELKEEERYWGRKFMQEEGMSAFQYDSPPIESMGLDFEKVWEIDGDGNLALKGMGKMDFSRNE